MDQARREQLADFAFGVRSDCIRMTNHGQSGHIGSMLSMADIITVLYNGVLNVDAQAPDKDDRDRFILSKGHAGAAVYAALCAKGFFPREWLMTYYCDEGKLMGHISHHVPGVEFSTGSLGHGLPVATGMALAAKVAGKKHRVFCLMSDGDMNEGSTWEAIVFAAQQKLSGLIGIIDYNRVQALGHSKDIANLEPLATKLSAFGWSVVTVNGHDLEALENTFARVPLSANKPTMIICRTIKSRGIPWLEDTVKSHYGFIPDDKVEEAIEGCRAYAQLTKEGGRA
ncbi:MAG: transketolase [Ruminococcaceae bacterium]|nr:transketolase [Oscillospiraceae bacterium]